MTMVQRSSTHIVRSDTLMEIGLAIFIPSGRLRGVTTRKADLIFASLPTEYARVPDSALREMRERDARFYADLEKAGFMLDWGADGSGLFMKYLRRGSGYYIDVGACDLVIDGSIKLKSGSDVSHLTEDAVVLKDGTVLPAELVVYATGYGSMNAGQRPHLEGGRRQGRQGVGPRLRYAERPGSMGGRAAQHVEADAAGGALVPRGNLHQSRHYSQYLSLQLKARCERHIDAGLWPSGTAPSIRSAVPAGEVRLASDGPWAGRILIGTRAH